MGAWGTAIFSNDLSSDVREEFRDLVADGLSPEAATKALMVEYAIQAPPMADPDDAADFWVGLALAQHRLGRLQPEVHRAAVAAAADPRELERWPSSDRKKRESALTKAIGHWPSRRSRRGSCGDVFAARRTSKWGSTSSTAWTQVVA